MTFFEKIERRFHSDKTLLCVGLDPQVEASGDEVACAAIIEANKRIIGATSRYAACYKPNIAFYEAWGRKGIEAFEATLALIPAEIPVIVDAKRGDIDSTGKAYAKAIFGRTRAEAVTVSPYLGSDAATPFLQYEDRCVFILCRNSNPSAREIQDQILGSGGRLAYERIAAMYASESGGIFDAGQLARIGLVVAGNDLEALARVRAVAPRAWFLAPGIGTQGGDAATAILSGCRDDGLGVLPMVARAISGASDPEAAARQLHALMNEAVEKAREGMKTSPRARTPKTLKEKTLEGLIRTECFKTGQFTLKSGKLSPFYVDLRRVVSDPVLLDDVAEAYASIAKGLAFDRVAGIPMAALPLATALAIKIGKPLIYPRLSAKDHGTGNRIEGDYKAGERVLLLDDLITTGLSKIEAIDALRAAGLVVEDLVVLIERGKQGRQDMQKAGVSLHAFTHVRDLIASCEAIGLIDAEARKTMEAFVDAE